MTPVRDTAMADGPVTPASMKYFSSWNEANKNNSITDIQFTWDQKVVKLPPDWNVLKLWIKDEETLLMQELPRQVPSPHRTLLFVRLAPTGNNMRPKCL